MNTQGKAFTYPDNVDTDVIIPARYLNTPDAKELALHCMEDIDTGFVKPVQAGDVMVAGWNFGCHCAELRAHFLPQRHQHRPPDPGMRGGGGRNLGRR